MIQEEPQEGPKWLKELEEKREKRLKARLGHEAGAGSPCLTCEEKCPGLDLHFWRKICKNCKCGKENHDVNDDDIYGWAQFQLLGSKPNKPKKIVLPGRKDAVELEWTPKGQNDVVESYLQDLPVNLLPIKGSAAAQERKQLLQKQIPLHDIDPTLCHALSEHEVKQMNDYIAHVKQNSVGIGHIMKLNELLKNRQSANAQILSSRAPMQIPQVQNIILQGVDRANSLKIAHGGHGGDVHKALRDLSLDEQKSLNVGQSEQVASNINSIRDVVYGIYGQGRGGNDNLHANSMSGGGVEAQNVPSFGHVSQLHNLKNMQMPQHNLANMPVSHHNLTNMPVSQHNLTNMPVSQHNLINMPISQHNLKNMQMPQQPVANQIDYQTSTNLGDVRDITYPYGTQEIPNHPNYNENDYQNARDVHYPFVNHNAHPKLTQNPNQPIHSQIDYQNPLNYGTVRDVHYPDNLPIQNHPLHGQGKRSNEQIPANFAQMYPQNFQSLPHYAKSSIKNMENTQKPVDFDLRNVYPDMNVNFEPHVQVGDLETNPEHLDNVSSLKGDGKMPHYVPGKFTTFVEQQSPQKIGNIKDLAYSTYDPSRNLDFSNENLQKYGEKNLNPQRPANYNPNEINVIEQSLNPTSINVGIINDIEYPTIKSAVQRENHIFEPEIPRKNVQFDLNPQEILPSCHKCKKMFDATAIVIGIDRTDALWHAECFKCTGCNQNLADLMYFYHKESDDIYCGRDYAKIRGIPRCQACDELIFVKEYCLAENSTFHVKHFCCFECDEPLAGQNYVMEDSQPLCLPCFEKVKAEKCNTCLQVIKPDEQGANLNGVHFHADDGCFACKMCKKPLLGAKLLFKNRNLYCSAPCFGADK